MRSVIAIQHAETKRKLKIECECWHLPPLARMLHFRNVIDTLLSSRGMYIVVKFHRQCTEVCFCIEENTKNTYRFI